uniref:Uncharacterized protein n=1 Tax=Arundo donax TaxID=35708 RepID=A0A0A8YP10_ARUDO
MLRSGILDGRTTEKRMECV